MGGIDYRPGHEKGIWYELVCLRTMIANKEATGKDATWERELYRAWIKDAEYSATDKNNERQGLYGQLAVMADGAEAIPSDTGQGIALTPTNTLPDFDVSTIMQHPKRGRPLKEGQVHRATEWRRQKAVQRVTA